MSTGIQISPPSGITIGTTAIDSGVDGRVLFQSGGVVQQDGAFFWDNTNKRLGVGANANSPSSTIFVRTNTSTAHDLLQLSNGFYGDSILRVRDNATASVSSTGSIFVRARMYGSNSTVTGNEFDLGGYGLGTSHGESASNAVWLNNQGNIGDLAGSSVISVASNFYLNLQTTKKIKFEGVSGHFGIGNVGTLGARLDVRAQGALSTDIAFRVRNSADTLNILQSTGDGKTRMQGSLYYTEFDPAIGLYIGNNYGNQISLSGVLQGTSWFNAGADSKLAVGRTGAGYRLHINSSTTNFNIPACFNVADSELTGTVGIAFTNTWTGDMFGNVGGVLNMKHTHLGSSGSFQHCQFDFNLNYNNSAPTTRASITGRSNVLLGTPTENLADSHTIYIPNGTAPTTSITDGFKQYSADIVAGNAAPHFRTEAGNIIKLYKETAANLGAGATFTNGTGAVITEDATFGGLTLAQIAKALGNLGLVELTA